MKKKEKLINYPDTCKGCKDYEDFHKIPCSLAYIKKNVYAPKELMCPCSICLVKMVCEHACHLLKEHKKLLKDMSYKKKKEN